MGQLSQKTAMAKRWAKILSGKTEVAVEQGQGKVYEVGKIAGYYNDLTGKVSPNTLLDSQGVPLSLIAGGAKVHFPIAIFQYALGCYDLSLVNPVDNASILESFRGCADWALCSQRADGSWDAFGPIGSEKYTVYDTGYWSYYDLEKRIASPAYHSLHVAQLKALTDLSGNESFMEMANTYEQYQKQSGNRLRAIAKKAVQKLSEKSDAVVIQ